MMLPLCTSVTLLRLLRTAYSIAARISRFEPDSEIGLMPMPESARTSQPKASFSSPRSFSASGVNASTSRPA